MATPYESIYESIGNIESCSPAYIQLVRELSQTAHRRTLGIPTGSDVPVPYRSRKKPNDYAGGLLSMMRGAYHHILTRFAGATYEEREMAAFVKTTRDVAQKANNRLLGISSGSNMPVPSPPKNRSLEDRV